MASAAARPIRAGGGRWCDKPGGARARRGKTGRNKARVDDRPKHESGGGEDRPERRHGQTWGTGREGRVPHKGAGHSSAMEDSNFGSKYDRQVRLWSGNGQRSLAGSRVCVVNGSPWASEILKNLVLPGVGSVVVVDSAAVGEEDLASNFFLGGGDVGAQRAVRLAETVSTLNPDVCITAVVDDRALFGDGDEDAGFWSSFDCVVLCAGPAYHACESRLSERLWALGVPLLKVGAVGFYAYLRIQTGEQVIVETHESNLHDLRLDLPWPALQQHVDRTSLADDSYLRAPYSVVLSKVFQQLQQNADGSRRPAPAAVRAALKRLYRTGDELNLDEAYSKAYLLMRNSAEIPPSVADILADRKTTHLDESSSLFWILCNALKCFYDTFHVLPLSGVLPDMESDTADYIRLRNIYTDKFEQDRRFIRDKALLSLRQLHRSPDELADNDSLLTLFVKNSRFLKVVRGSKWDTMPKILEVFKSGNEQLADKALIYLAFLTLESFAREHHRSPTFDDRPELRTTAIAILCNNHDVKTFPEGFDKVLDEMCRACGRSLHNVCAVIGGITAQEVIKILTNQYIPLDNCLVYDGITGRTSTFKL